MDKRRELREQYKNRRVIGGIYRVVNKENGRFYLQSTDDMRAAHNRFESSRVFGCPYPPLQKDWKEFGMCAFSMEELDLLVKAENQTFEEFTGDLKTLLDLWSDKLPDDNRY